MSTFGPYKATISGIHDGDTVKVNVVLAKVGKIKRPDGIDLGFGVHRTPDGLTLMDQAVRTFGDNAPELATQAGKDALAFLQTLLKVGDAVTLLSHGWDKYGGRIDGTITLADGRDLAQAMIDGGHAVFWNGQGPKPTAGLVVT